VLTVFERLSFEQLPFYLHLMKHLAGKGIPVPDPAADAQGEILHRLKGKPAAVVNKLRGRSELAPSAAIAPRWAPCWPACTWPDGLPRHQPNLRGLAWWNETVPVVLPHLDRHRRPCSRPSWPTRTTWRPAPELRRPAARPGARRPVPRQRDVRCKAS
jgi:homoserine kinase type II